MIPLLLSTLRRAGLQRGVACLVCAAMLLPVLAGCAAPPRQPTSVMLAGIVVDGARAAAPGETGLVSVWREGRLIEGQPGLALRVGDRVETGPRADAVIAYPSGSRLYLRPSSGGRIGSFSEAVGEMFARIKGLFAVETAFVRAGARGTEFLVRTGPAGETTVVVFEGRVACESITGAWSPVELGAGAMLIAEARALRPPRPFRAGEAELNRSREWVERLDRLVPPQQRSAAADGSAVLFGAVAAAAAAAILLGRDGDRPAGGDQPAPQRRPLAAPTATGPGSADARKAPALACGRPIVLRWRGVSGADGYQVTVEVETQGRWRTERTRDSRDDQLALTLDAGKSYRWTVRARDERGTGPPSAPLHFICPAYVR